MQYVSNAVQTVPSGGSLTFDPNFGCRRCCNNGITHRPGSGIFTLQAGRTYLISFKANIALAEGAAVGPIALALAIDCEAVPVTRAIVTPTAVGDYFGVYLTYELAVPCQCCQNVSVENVLPSADAAGVPVDVQNAIIRIDPK